MVRAASALVTSTVPPQSIEAEQGVLGSMLLERDTIARVVEMLRREDFYQQAHRYIYDVIVDLFEHGEPVDLITVTDRVKARGQLQGLGGAVYVTSLLDAIPTAANVEYYIRLVRRDGVKRDLLMLAAEIAHATNDGHDPEELIALVGRSVEDMRERLESGADPRTARAEVLTLGELLADTSPDPPALVEGLVWPQTITLVAAPTKYGKTQAILQLARAVASGQSFLGLRVPAAVPVLYVGQEDALWALRRRMRGIDPKFGSTRATLHLSPVKGLLLEGGGVRRLVERHRPGLLLLDPLRRFHVREEEKGEMALVIRELDLIIRDFGCAVVVTHHTRKPADRRRRSLEVADVRGSSVITDQANTIALLARDDEPDQFTLTITGNYAAPQTLRLQRVGAVFERRGTHESVTVREAVEAFADRSPLRRAEAVGILQEHGLKRRSAYERVAKLIDTGWLLPAAGGRFTLNANLLDARPEVSS